MTHKILLISLALLLSACSNLESGPTVDSSDTAKAEKPEPVVTSAQISGKWRVEYINNYPVIDFSPAYIEFSEDGDVTGNATCNQFTGRFTLSQNQLSFSPLASTGKMCGHAQMHQEDKMNRALTRVVSLELKTEFGFLILKDKNNNTLFRLVK